MATINLTYFKVGLSLTILSCVKPLWITLMKPFYTSLKMIFSSLFTAAMLVLSSAAFAASLFNIDEELSSVSFATTKLQYVIEPASIDGLKGGIDGSGKLTLEIPIANIQTGVPIRNERLNKLFFNAQNFPSAQVSVDIPTNILAAHSSVTQSELPARVTLFGKSIDIKFKVNVVKTPDVIAVSSVVPVIVRGSSFGIPSENLTALAQTVGGIPISDAVPVTFSLILKK